MTLHVDERSWGVVPIERRGNNIYVYIVRHLSGAWLLPKGHALENETHKQTAERELQEETQLSVVKWLKSPPFVEQYVFSRDGKQVGKEVEYFPALVSGMPLIQKEELLDGSWVLLEDFERSVTFSEMKRIAHEVRLWIKESI